jgi:hypothetical protein
MTSQAVLPLVGVTACLKSRDEFHFHSVGTKYVDAKDRARSAARARPSGS